MFKTILVFSLCIGVVLPTNAAVSVSDGSAFVTKAEFAADLNNLSNRMAQLENSLDAKIDSLVSSYLTRNGIWNGAKQTLNLTTTDEKGWQFDSTRNTDTTNFKAFPYYQYTSFMNMDASNFYLSTPYNYGKQTVILIDSCNKYRV